MADIVKITSAPNFTDEDTPVMEYSVYSNIQAQVTQMEAYISLDGTTALSDIRTVSQYESSCSFSLSTEERGNLRAAVTSGNSIRVYYIVACYYGTTKYTTRAQATMTLVNYAPTLSPTVTIADSRTFELTGSKNTLIDNYTTVTYNMGATGRKGARIVSMQVINGGTLKQDSNTGTISPVTSNTFYFSAVDSRGNSVREAIVKTLIPYVKPTASIESEPISATGTITATISGQYYSGSFGAKSNTMDIDYEIHEVGTGTQSWNRLIDVSPTVVDNSYSYTLTITGVDYRKEYELNILVIDELGNSAADAKIISSVPVFDWGKDDFKHNTDVELETGKALTARNSDYINQELLCLTSDDIFRIGYGGISNAVGETHLYGEDVYIQANGRVTLTANQIALFGNLLEDFVVDQASNGYWHYRKWNSGRVELSGYQNINSIACNTALGGWYRTAVQTAPAFPFTVYNPKTVSSYNSNGYGALLWNTTLDSSSKPADYYLIRPTSSSAITGIVNFYTVGTWR